MKCIYVDISGFFKCAAINIGAVLITALVIGGLFIIIMLTDGRRKK